MAVAAAVATFPGGAENAHCLAEIFRERASTAVRVVIDAVREGRGAMSAPARDAAHADDHSSLIA